MTLHIQLENNERLTNLKVADSILELCKESYTPLDPYVIAKAILLELEKYRIEGG